MAIRKHVLALTLLLVVLLAASAAANGGSGYTAEIMGLGMGARALGMGGAHIAVAEDASVIYYNPAGLGQIERFSLVSLYTNQYGALNFLTLGAAYQNFGAGMLRLSASGIEETGEYGDEIGTFSVAETALLLGYGRTITDGLSLGGSFKYYGQDLPENKGRGFTADLGILYTLPEGKGSVGFVGRNLFGKVKYSSEAEAEFNRSFGLGLAYRPMDELLLAADAVIEQDFSARFGAEYTLRSGIALRAGAALGDDTSLTLGAGFAVSDFKIDYAYQYNRVLPDSHRLSLRLEF